MKRIVLIACMLSVLSCKKDSISVGDKILSISVNGRTVTSFEYDQDGRLILENDYSSCTGSPMNKYAYTYKNNKLEKVNWVVRAHYSSTVAQCDPSMGMHLEDVFSYDSDGRIIKIVGATTRENLYNSQGFIIKRLLGGGSNKFFEYFYDSRGNVIKEIDQGNVTEYEFDSSPNPFYQHHPHVGTAFTMSPNNVIKGKGARNFVRKFEYRSNKPVKLFEDNGETYIYHYE